jgi:hypothetical protein
LLLSPVGHGLLPAAMHKRMFVSCLAAGETASSRLPATRPGTRRWPRPHLAAARPPPLVRDLEHEDPRNHHRRRATVGSPTCVSRTRPACHPSPPWTGSRPSRKHRSRPTRYEHPGTSSVRRVGVGLPGSCSGSHAERAGGRDGPLVSQCTQGTASRRAARRIGPLSSGGPSRVALGLRVGDRSAAG